MQVWIWNTEVEMLGSFEAGKLGGLKAHNHQNQPNQRINKSTNQPVNYLTTINFYIGSSQ